MKITLCGSTRFLEAFQDWDVILTKAGHTVYTICRSDGEATPEEKRRFDLVHLDKISQSDAIVVLNVDGYFGESTAREIEWARMHRKDIYWLDANPAAGRAALGVSVRQLYDLFGQQVIESGDFKAHTPEAAKYL